MPASIRELELALDKTELRPLWEFCRQHYRSDPAHNFSHIERVALWTLRCQTPEFSFAEAIAAALFHDFVNLPKNHPERKQAASLSANAAKELLPSYGFGPESIEKIAQAIREHSFSAGLIPSADLGRALQDADRLEALGAIGIYRWLITGARMGADFFHQEDPWAIERELNDTKYSVDHCFTKLFRLAESFQHPEAKKEALRRTEIIKKFLIDLSVEIGKPYPLE